MYEKKHPFLGFLVNYDDDSYVDADDSDDDDMDPNWLSQIIQTAIRGFESPFVSVRCWSTLPKWERDNWMNVQPSKYLILINGHTHQG